MRRTPLFPITFALTLFTLGACGHGALAQRPHANMGSPTVLSRQDFKGEMDGRNMYDVLRALRPSFLRARGGDVSVAVDGMLLGSPAVLRDITAETVQQVELLNGPDATLRFGTRHAGVVLLITTRRR